MEFTAEILDQPGALGREARRQALHAVFASQAQLAHVVTRVVQAADRHRDWQADGYRTSTSWFAEVSSSDYRTAAKATRTSEALPALPALDNALATGTLTFDQVAAAARFATPASDRELARIAPGKAPSEISIVARTMAPPTADDDAALHARRSLSLSWTHGRGELMLKGRLPLEQGIALEQAIWGAALAQRATEKPEGVVLDWQQSCADALVALVEQGGVGADLPLDRTRTTLIVHLAEGEPPSIEGAGPISHETCDRLTCTSRRLFIRRDGRDLVHSRVTRSASYAQLRALHRRDGHCRYPGCTARRRLEAHHIVPHEDGGETVLDNLILLCGRHHKRLHDQHIRTSGRALDAVFTDASGRVLTSLRAHAPPG